MTDLGGESLSMKKKKYVYYILAFLIPFCTAMGICFGTGVYPFGDRCILHVDMYHQYCPFFTEFLNKLQNGGSLMYTWNQGLGTDFVALYAYYLASPLNWLLIFVPGNHVIEFMTILIWLKMGMCGLSMFLYLKYHFALADKDGQFRKNTVWVALVCAAAYALSGFVAAYSWNIMWMDSVALFPLIVLGLEQLVKEKKVLLYFLTLALAIWSNYYIALMICMFVAVYFVYLFFCQKGGRAGAFVRFAACSLLAGGVSAVILIPEIRILGYSGSSGVSFPEQAEWYFSVIGELSRTCAVADAYTGNQHWPNLYAGTFALLALVLFALNKCIDWKKRLLGIAAVAFFYVSFASNYLDFIWHGFHFPNSLPGRQAFLYVFVVLVLGFAAVHKWQGIRIWHILIALGLWLVLLIAGMCTTDKEITDTTAFLVTLGLLVIYAAGMIMLKKANAKNAFVLQVFLVLLAFGELITNMGIVGFYTTSRSAYTAKMDDYEVLLEKAQELEQQQYGEDAVFFRVEDPQRMTKNDSALYGYSSATEFSSLMNIHVSHLYQSMYMEGGKNFYCYNGATPLTSALFSVKYTILNSNLEENEFRRLVAQSGDYYLYENIYTLPLGYMMSEQAVEQWDNSNRSRRIQNLNAFTQTLGIEEPMISSTYCKQEIAGGNTTIQISQPGYYYAAYKTCASDTLTAEMSDGRKRKFSKTTHRYLLELGACEAGDEIVISNTKDEAVEFYLYRIDSDVVRLAYEILSRQTLELQEITDTRISGSVTVQDEGRLILSVPAESGWTLWVDGQETEIEPYKDALISVHLDEGEHEILLRYRTPGLLAGGIISICCAGIFALGYCLYRRKSTKRQDGITT